MPSYDMKCSDCSEKFSVMVSVKDKERLNCPKCGSRIIKQEFSRVNIASVANSTSKSCKSANYG